VPVLSPSWAAYVKEHRRTRRITRREMARLASIDPSYVTLIERDGMVPRQDVVCRLGRALLLDEDRTLVAAGYAPRGIPLKELLHRVESHKLTHALDPALQEALEEVYTLPVEYQGDALQLVHAFVAVLRAKQPEGALP
jgi:transcriptional regulator with XRE-family HTH domain